MSNKILLSKCFEIILISIFVFFFLTINCDWHLVECCHQKSDKKDTIKPLAKGFNVLLGILCLHPFHLCDSNLCFLQLLVLSLSNGMEQTFFLRSVLVVWKTSRGQLNYMYAKRTAWVICGIWGVNGVQCTRMRCREDLSCKYLDYHDETSRVEYVLTYFPQRMDGGLTRRCNNQTMIDRIDN